MGKNSTFIINETEEQTHSDSDSHSEHEQEHEINIKQHETQNMLQKNMNQPINQQQDKSYKVVEIFNNGINAIRDILIVDNEENNAQNTQYKQQIHTNHHDHSE